jgi:HK97 family phage major capsid protein
LATGKTAPADVTLADLQNLRSKVSAAVLSNMSVDGRTSAAYYLHPTFEPLLRSFNKYPNYIVFEYVNGQPMFEGYPVHWIGVSQPNTTSAAAAKPVAFFGDLSYWYLGEKGQIRIEISKEVYFATDELAMRALERIDIQNMAVDAMATLKTAAS